MGLTGGFRQVHLKHLLLASHDLAEKAKIIEIPYSVFSALLGDLDAVKTTRSALLEEDDAQFAVNLLSTYIGFCVRQVRGREGAVVEPKMKY